jgi:hypothetical protein
MSRATLIGSNISAFRTSETRLAGRWLLLVRVAWVALVSFVLVFLVTSLSDYLTHLQTICTGANCADKQLTPASAQALEGIGISLDAYAAFAFALTLFSVMIWLAVGGIVAWRKSDDWMALLVALALVLVGIANLTGASSSEYYALLALSFPAQILNFFGFTAEFFAIALFPSGRFVPRWFAWLAIPFLANAVWYNFLSFGHAGLALPVWVDGLSGLLFVGQVVSSAATQIYRYRQISTPVQRQQTKWVVFGIVANLMVMLGIFLPTLIVPSLSRPGSLYNVVLTPLTTLIALLIPLSIGVAILHYRLWDIDALINKALVYGGLSAILGTLYACLVIGFGSLVGVIGGQVLQEPVVLVISTVAVAALFRPLRTRLQTTIDRRFYRRKYDAEKVLAAFSSTLQHEVDLATLSEHLVAVVQETMQPTQVSLWLCRTGQQLTRSTSRL